MGDEQKTRQILYNLLGNAIKFTESGGITVVINYQSTETNLGELIVSIKDTGIGISEQQQGKLFSAFSQVDSSSTRKQGGTGLGLAIVKSMVTLLGGEITLKSAEGLGSEFKFNIPFKLTSAESANAPDRPLIALYGNPLTANQLTSLGYSVELIDAEMHSVLQQQTDLASKYKLLLLTSDYPGQALFWSQYISSSPPIAYYSQMVEDSSPVADVFKKIPIIDSSLNILEIINQIDSISR
jgi:hypothetical protein